MSVQKYQRANIIIETSVECLATVEGVRVVILGEILGVGDGWFFEVKIRACLQVASFDVEEPGLKRTNLVSPE